MAPPPPLIIDSKAVSGITGSISIACWIIVFAPQLYENFRRGSAEGLSLSFVVLWLAGDVFNVLGCILQGVLPTMMILALYYTLADVVLLYQCLAYGHKEKVDAVHLNPATPLNEDVLEEVLDGEEDEESLQVLPMPKWKIYLYNALMVLLVVVAGVLGWYISSGSSSDSPDVPDIPDTGDELSLDPVGQIFGWLCAFLYLGSRVPQIWLNYKRRSCEGISFLFFLFACLGNLTYVVSIMSWSLDPLYLLVNASWLAGSTGTLLLDFVIFVQFWLYDESEYDEYEPIDD